MKKIILLSLLLSQFAAGNAQLRSTAEMKTIAREAISQYMGTCATEPHQMLERTNLAVYTAQNQGCVVISRVGTETVLGYTDAPVDANNLPEAFVWWLDETNKSLSSLTSHLSPLTSNLSPVSPMLTTLWAQDAPYNNLCPKTGGFWGGSSQTGCVATAMAQILNYMKYPEKSVGNGYYTIDDANSTKHKVKTETTFKWDQMANQYRYGYTEAQATAVAELMRDCGYASRMMYSSQGSGTTAFDAGYGLAHNMQCDSLALHVDRRMYYTDDEWMDIIYGEMQAGRPVLYNATDPNMMGHAFVFDGLDAEGRVHVNWGWSGDANGYFDVRLLQGLNPSYPNPYTGGEVRYTFSDDHMMVRGIQPSTAATADEHYTSFFGMVEPDEMWFDNDALKIKQSPMFNFTHLEFTGMLGVVIMGEDGHAVVLPFFYTPWNNGDAIPYLSGMYPTEEFYPQGTLNEADQKTPRPDGKYYIYLCSWALQEMQGDVDPQYIHFPVVFAAEGKPNYNIWEARIAGGHWDASSMRITDDYDNETADIHMPTVAEAIRQAGRIYNINGQPLPSPQHGLNIIVGDDGKARKVIR